MAPLARPAAGAALRTLRRQPFTKTASASTPGLRAFSVTPPRASGGDNHYDPPSGWLWGVPPGTKPEKEGWEAIWLWGFCGSLGLAVVAYNFKPDTNIETWALEEAKRRLQAEGILPEES